MHVTDDPAASDTAASDTAASDTAALVSMLRGKRVVALTGAGCSTESGIPDYRGLGSKVRNPVQYRPFLEDPLARQRYWARSMVGWPRFSAAAPNEGHRALAAMQRAGAFGGVITQNVDGLHQAAGHERVIELHGSLAEVLCLQCGTIEGRATAQQRLLALNPGWTASAELAPDGDAELTSVDGFVVPDCARCGGMLKPNVVFFGENVPAVTVQAAFGMLEDSEVLLVVGTSLTVYSGFRFVRRAAERGMPVAIVNIGPTRGDPLATLCVNAPAGRILGGLAKALAS